MSSGGSADPSAPSTSDPTFYFSIHGDRQAGQQVEFDATGDFFRVTLSPVIGTLTAWSATVWIQSGGDDAHTANFTAKLYDSTGAQVGTTQTIVNGIITSAGTSHSINFTGLNVPLAKQPLDLRIDAVALAEGFDFPLVSDLLATSTYTPSVGAGGISRSRAMK